MEENGERGQQKKEKEPSKLPLLSSHTLSSLGRHFQHLPFAKPLKLGFSRRQYHVNSQNGTNLRSIPDSEAGVQRIAFHYTAPLETSTQTAAERL